MMVKRILLDAEEREKFFMELYKTSFPVIAKYISRRGGSFDEAKDIFQDAVVLYYEKLVENKLNLQVNEQAYLLGIARHLWIRKYNLNSRNIDIDEAGQLTEQEEPLPLTHKLLDFLENAGQKCMDLLKAFYYDKLNMGEVAQQFGYSGERSATVQKYKCLEKVRDTVKQKALTYEDFLE